MKRIKVSSLPLKDVISDISNALDVSFSESCNLYTLSLPAYIGTGVITGIDFEDGLGLIAYDCTFFENIVFEFSVNEVHPLKFLFCLEGSFEHNFENEDEWHAIPQYKNAIVASNKKNGHVIRFRKNEHTILHSLELSRSKFQRKMNCELKSLSNSLKILLTDIAAKETFYYDGFYSLELADLFREIHTFEEKDYLKKLFLEGTAYRILVLQILQYQDDLNNEGTVIRKAELKQLETAVELINERISDLPTIEEIGLEVGLNPKKLQKGFQELVGSSVNTYVKKKRLETAKTLLTNTDKPLAEISDIIGYKSSGYLTKVFKVEYGLSPSEFRKRNLD